MAITETLPRATPKATGASAGCLKGTPVLLHGGWPQSYWPTSAQGHSSRTDHRGVFLRARGGGGAPLLGLDHGEGTQVIGTEVSGISLVSLPVRPHHEHWRQIQAARG